MIVRPLGCLASLVPYTEQLNPSSMNSGRDKPCPNIFGLVLFIQTASIHGAFQCQKKTQATVYQRDHFDLEQTPKQRAPSLISRHQCFPVISRGSRAIERMAGSWIYCHRAIFSSCLVKWANSQHLRNVLLVWVRRRILVYLGRKAQCEIPKQPK